MHCLDGIDDQQGRRFAPAHGRQDIADRSRRREPDGRSAEAKAHRAQPHLLGGFLTGDVDDLLARTREPRRDLQQERRFADARIAADQQGGTCHNAVADRPVELGKTAG